MHYVYLVDASIFVFRAWYSLPFEFSDPEGRPTNAVYGFTRFTLDFLRDVDPAELVFAFDESLESSFRNEILPSYKANRESAPDELRWQFKQCQAVAEALGIACLCDGRFEADDLLATVAKRLPPKSFCVVSGDKDLAQLVGESDRWWDFGRGNPLSSKDLRKKFGVKPEQLGDYLALVGDAVDNIPGVTGVGPKTAASLLQHFRDLDGIFARLDEIPHLRIRGAKTLKGKLAAQEEKARLSRKVIALHEQANVPEDFSCVRQTADPDGVREHFDRLGFGLPLRKLAAEIGAYRD